MAICRYCGQKAGWFRETHDECVRNAEQVRLQMEQARVQKANEEAHKRFLHETQEHNLREYQKWRLQHSALLDKFLEITERKVSLLDDYGDENWDALPKEIETLLLKTAKADNHDI